MCDFPGFESWSEREKDRYYTACARLRDAADAIACAYVPPWHTAERYTLRQHKKALRCISVFVERAKKLKNRLDAIYYAHMYLTSGGFVKVEGNYQHVSEELLKIAEQERRYSVREGIIKEPKKEATGERYYKSVSLEIVAGGAFVWRCCCVFLASYRGADLRKFADNCYFEIEPKQIKCIEDIANKSFYFRLIFTEALSRDGCRDLETRFFDAIEANLTPCVDKKEG